MDKTAAYIFETVEQLTYLGTTLKNQSSFHEEIKSIIKSGVPAVIWSRIFCVPLYYPEM
jgi:hypothetical protein